MAIGSRQFSCVFRLESPDLFFCPDPIRDIPDDRSDMKAFLGRKRTQTNFNRKSCSILALPLQQQAAAHGTRLRMGAVFGTVLSVANPCFIRYQNIHVFVEQFFPAVSE